MTMHTLSPLLFIIQVKLKKYFNKRTYGEMKSKGKINEKILGALGWMFKNTAKEKTLFDIFPPILCNIIHNFSHL